MSTQDYQVLKESSFIFVDKESREVLRITNEARLVIGEGLSKDEATQETAKLLVAAFEEQIQKMLDKRIASIKSELDRAEKAEADTKRLDWIASRKSTELVYFAAAGWSVGWSGPLFHDKNVYGLRAAIDAAMKEATNK